MKDSSQALAAYMPRGTHMPPSDHLQLSKISEGCQILKNLQKETETQTRHESFSQETILRVVIPDVVGIWLVNSKESVQ